LPRARFATRLCATVSHAYPIDLARFIAERFPHLEVDALARVFSVAFQASLLREEERPVVFRLLLADPAELAREGGPPGGLHRLVFDTPRPFDEHELRRLAPAAKLQRSLIGVTVQPDGTASIWGLAHSGPGWLRVMQGARGATVASGGFVTVSVTGPGRVLVSRGGFTVAKLAAGRLSGAPLDVFDADWLGHFFAEARDALMQEHARARRRAEVPWAEVDPQLATDLRQQFLRRVLAQVRTARHGGTLLFVPPACAEDLSDSSRWLTMKYRFQDEEPRRRLSTLLTNAINLLSAAHPSSLTPLDFHSYQKSTDRAVAAADEAIFELAHFVAGLAEVDGAVLLTHRFELLGFGGEIGGELPHVDHVFRALDLEGEHVVQEAVDGVGTRHRSVYRLAGAYPDTLGVVVSQDGSIRFVRSHAGRVLTWDQVATSSLEL
jgi:hypothetical protein